MDAVQSSRKGGSHRGSADTTGITSWGLNKGRNQRGNGDQSSIGERRALAAAGRYSRGHWRGGASGEGGGEGCCVKPMGRGPGKLEYRG